MSCDEIQSEIPFYCYGEISSEREEIVEQHLAACPACRAELDRHRKFLEAIDSREDAADSGLLTACRADLHASLNAPKRHSFWDWRVPLPVAAAALIALGFFAGRFVPDSSPAVFSSVASIEPAASGQVRIAVDETRRHMVSGRIDEPRIQSLLLGAMREESNPGVRAESVSLMRRHADSEEVRGALIDRLANDPNPAVRRGALEGLKAYPGDAVVRRTLANVLLRDDNPDLRIQAIDLLTIHHDDSIVGVLQDAVRKEDNTVIRLRCGRLLEEMKASVGTY